ncbi:MAG: gliding motility-associated C-terminal domain-containing protein [Bacteroidota bacterium]
MRNLLTKITFLFSGLLAVFSIPNTYADHVIGADLTYECLGGNTYQFTLTVYRDCSGAFFTTPPELSFSSSCGFTTTQPTTFVGSEEISQLCPTELINSTCNSGSPSALPGIEKYTYTVTQVLAPCADWTVSWNVCCRNQAVTNLNITNTTELYVEATIDNLDGSCNSSPVFSNDPVINVCEGDPFSFNNGVTDADGDSLVFDLITPRNFVSGSFPSPIGYVGAFNPYYPVATAPANTFSFDRNTGQMEFTPSGIQRSVVTTRVTEYRNGRVIGTTMRDVLMVVQSCANSKPTFTPSLLSGAGTSLNGNTVSVCAGSPMDLQIQVDDPDAGEVVSIASNLAEAIPAANISTSGSNPVLINVQWSPTVADLGNYIFTVRAADNSCPFKGESSIAFNIQVQTSTVLPTKDYFICPGVTSSLQIEATTADNGGTYTWSPTTNLSNPNIRNPIANVGLPTTYTVTYQEAGGCPIVEEIVIQGEGELTVVDNTVEMCTGGSVQLEANFTLNGSSVPFNFVWDSPAGLSDPLISNPIASPPTSTVYSVRVLTPSCTYEENVFVRVDQPVNLGILPDVSVCDNDSVNLLPSGTTFPLSTFQWVPTLGLDDPNRANPKASPSINTTYTLTVSNACGTEIENVNVRVSPPLNSNVAINNVSCFGADDGSLSVVTTGGSGTLSYTWSPALSDNATQTGLMPGNYEVIVQDENNCADTLQAPITEPPLLELDITEEKDVTCSDNKDGLISVAATGGVPAYQYSLDGFTYLDLNTFTGLQGGTYIVSARDQNNCIVSTAPIQIQAPAQLNLVVVGQVNPSCNTNFGLIEVTGDGGTPGYTYSIDGINFGTDPVFDGLGPGSYNLDIRDANGCDSRTIAQIQQISDPFGVVDSLANISCFDEEDGAVLIDASSGTPGYEYAIDGQPFGLDSLFTDLRAGQHVVVIRDDLGCEFNVNFEIIEPTELSAVIGSQAEPSCNGLSDGTAVILGNGGTSPYQYRVGAGPYTPINTFNNLGAGASNFEVRDSNGCLADVNIVLFEPDLLEMSVDSTTDIVCNGESGGAVFLSATGGMPNYLYSLDGNNFFNVDNFNSLSTGDYTFYSRDANQCVDSIDVTITEPPILNPIILDTNPIPCAGENTGLVEISAEGGMPPYTYSTDNVTFGNTTIFDQLVAGSYSFFVRDDLGCVREINQTLFEPEPLFFTSNSANVSCDATNDGFASVEVSGGITPYSYAWSNGETGASVSNLSGGILEVIIRDANGCSLNQSFDIVQNPPIFIDSLLTDDVSCFGASDGSARVVARGGSGFINYSWSNSGTTAEIQAISGGTYVITLTDTEDCVLTDSVVVNEPEQLAVNIQRQEDARCELTNGLLSIEALGGTPTYDYMWDTDPPTDATTITDLSGGDYTISIIDANDCQIDSTITVEVLPSPVADFTPVWTERDSSVWNPQGTDFLNLSSGAIRYEWNFGDGNFSTETDPTNEFLGPGTYWVSLTAYDALGECPDVDSLLIELVPRGNVYLPNAFSPNSDGRNDEFRPVGLQINEFKMTIYDQWGTLVKETNGLNEGWDGIGADGKTAPEGVYVFVIRALINDGTVYERTGSITLIR